MQAGVLGAPEEVGPETKNTTFALFGAVLGMSAGPEAAEGLSEGAGASVARGLTGLVAAPVASDEELTDTAAAAVGVLDGVSARSGSTRTPYNRPSRPY